jgi:hypothetical protein
MHDVSRLAPASITVCERHADNPAIASHVSKVVPAANRVLSALPGLEQLKMDQVKLVQASKQQTAELNDRMVYWLGPVARDLEGFDIGAFTRDAKRPFDVLQKGTVLKQIVEQQGVDLPYRELLLTELTARIDSTREADQAAQAARVAVQQKQAEIRQRSAEFHKELVSFRRTVRGALGSNHYDYQRLRVTGRDDDAEPPDEASDADSTPSDGAPPSSTS